MAISNTKEEASRINLIELLENLVQDNKIDLNFKCEEKNPLCLCAELDVPEAADVLLNHGAHLSAEVSDLTAIEIAVKNDSHDVIEVFNDYIKVLEGPGEVYGLVSEDNTPKKRPRISNGTGKSKKSKRN